MTLRTFLECNLAGPVDRTGTTRGLHCRTGRWKDAVTANVRAYKADMEFTKHCMVAYGPEHNTDMLIYAANMAGMVCNCCLFSAILS